jgi:hypothetical protein
MAPKPDDLDELDGDDLPDEEEEFLEQMGLGADGTRMQLGDTDLTGRPWEPDRADDE